MKAKVIEDRCIGCGQCEAVCDEVFKVDGIAQVIVDEIKEEFKNDAKMAASGCPTDAIIVEEN